MSIIDTLVTDRKQSDVDRLKFLDEKGWDNMTEDERGEWCYGKLIPMIGPDGEQLQDVNGELLYCRDGVQRGSYDASDMNRVGAAMNYVAARLIEQGYDPKINPKTYWKDGECVTPADQAVYLGDLAELRKQFALLSTTPEVPPRILATGIKTNDGLTYAWANDIEKILEDIDQLLTNAEQAWFYSGDLFSGEV